MNDSLLKILSEERKIDGPLQVYVNMILLKRKGMSFSEVADILLLDELDEKKEFFDSFSGTIQDLLAQKYNISVAKREGWNDATLIEKIYSKSSVNHLEHLFAKNHLNIIEKYLDYIDHIYNDCFKIIRIPNDKKNRDINPNIIEKIEAIKKIFYVITNFFRSIQFSIGKGYPSQAGSLACSIFELVHTSIYILNNPNSARLWQSCNSADIWMPSYIMEKKHKKRKKNPSWKDLIEINCTNGGIEEGYEIYNKLCMMKHSHPKILPSEPGPYFDSKFINHAWFSTYYAGKPTITLLSKFKKFLEGHKIVHSQINFVLLEEQTSNMIQMAQNEFNSTDLII